MAFIGELKLFVAAETAQTPALCDFGFPRACHGNLGHTSLKDKQRSGRPRTATSEARRNYVEDMIKENRRVSQHATANKTAACDNWIWVIES
jgi:hypothetical protein